MNQPHKHAELIKAWADGAEIEWKNDVGIWLVAQWPEWNDKTEYRIKPQVPKPDVVRYAKVFLEKEELKFKYFFSDELDSSFDNLKLTFDGETGKLKSAEVLK